MHWLLAGTMLLLTASLAAAAPPTLEQPQPVDGEWGYRPADGATSETTPPGFTWRPQQGLVSWDLQVGQGAGFETLAYEAEGLDLVVHRPPVTLEPGTYAWRYRGRTAEGEATEWSPARGFTIPDDAQPFTLPTREELLARVPEGHPRLFVRPEQMDELRELGKGPLKPQYDALMAWADKLIDQTPPTAEPPTYPEGTVRNSEEWRKIWWGNRTYTSNVLNGAAILGFAWQLSGEDKYADLGTKLLMDAAEWDPKGATGYRYNDEAGMPYAYYFSRAYTFLHDHLTEAQREKAREVMKVRGEEMYEHLNPRHLYRPYSSHSNRAWHFLGEIGIAFLNEIEGADDWVWFATNVFANVYPVWADDDGGWHEGQAYWDSYLSRFTWWADIMRAALGIDAYDLPFFKRAGDFALYTAPPNKTWGGFGDLAKSNFKSRNLADLVTTFAVQSGNPWWQWYVEANGGPFNANGYVGYVRGALPAVEAQEPTALPASKAFRGTGLAALNSTLLDAREGVQVLFKSSPFGTQSHGYDANNSFILYAYGQPLLINTGRRDSYGTEHHRDWMWSTRSVNAITVDGHGQRSHTAAGRGRIVDFATTPSLDLVVGEAGEAYVAPASVEEREQGITDKRVLDRFTRAIVFAKPELVLVFDRLDARQASTYTYWLHSPNQFALDGPEAIATEVEGVRCEVDFLAPQGLVFDQTNQYDPNPRERIKVREWHLTAVTPEPAEQQAFVTLLRPHRAGDAVPAEAELTPLDGGYALRAKLTDGELVALLPTSDRPLRALGLQTTGRLVAERRGADGTVMERIEGALE